MVRRTNHKVFTFLPRSKLISKAQQDNKFSTIFDPLIKYSCLLINTAAMDYLLLIEPIAHAEQPFEPPFQPSFAGALLFRLATSSAYSCFLRFDSSFRTRIASICAFSSSFRT